MKKIYSILAIVCGFALLAACEASEAITRNAISFNDYNYSIAAAEQGYTLYTLDAWLDDEEESCEFTADNVDIIYKETEDGDTVVVGRFFNLVFSSPNITSITDSTCFEGAESYCEDDDVDYQRFLLKQYQYPEEGKYIQVLLQLFSPGTEKICEGEYVSRNLPDGNTKYVFDYDEDLPIEDNELITGSYYNSLIVVPSEDGPDLIPIKDGYASIKQGTMAYEVDFSCHLDLEATPSLSTSNEQNSIIPPVTGHYTGIIPQTKRILVPGDLFELYD